MGATGHQERLLCHLPVNERAKHLFCFSTRSANDFYACGKQHFFERLGDSAANQYIHPEACDASGQCRDFCFIQRVLHWREFALIFEVDNHKPPGNVEDRRNPSVTNWNGNSHDSP
jgi:hypothetical protein